MDMTQDWCNNDEKQRFSFYILSYGGLELLKEASKGIVMVFLVKIPQQNPTKIIHEKSKAKKPTKSHFLIG